jgi:hypothetical protein
MAVTRQRLFLALVPAPLLVWLAIFSLDLCIPNPVDRLRPGMTIAETEAILGEPDSNGRGPLGEGWTRLAWNLDGRKVIVDFADMNNTQIRTARFLQEDGLSRRQQTRNWLREYASFYFDVGPLEKPRGQPNWPLKDAY